MADLGPGAIIAGQIRILSHLADGGMGRVYVAEHLGLGRKIALKAMHPMLVSDPAARTRFAQETLITSHIQSAHVVDVLSAGVDDARGTPWLAMELLEGEPLEAKIRREGPVPIPELLPILRQIADCMGAAHRIGIVHRDLKPENVFLCKAESGAPFVKVLDFGIAKWVVEARGAATATTALGSPVWMAAEQTEDGGKISTATDVWAFGLLVFYAITGKPFWRAANRPSPLAALIKEIVLDPIPRASQRATELGFTRPLPAGLDDWMSRAVVRDPLARFATATAAMVALDAVLGLPTTRVGDQVDARGQAAYLPTRLADDTGPLLPDGFIPPAQQPMITPLPMQMAAPPSAPTAPMTPTPHGAHPTPVSTPVVTQAPVSTSVTGARPARGGRGAGCVLAGVLGALFVAGGGGAAALWAAGVFDEGPEPPPPIVIPHGSPPPVVIAGWDAGPIAILAPLDAGPLIVVRFPDAGRPADAGSTMIAGGTPLDSARACADQGNWECVVRTLEGTARSERELSLLVDGYVRTRNSGAATRTMRRYMLNFPTGRRATEFRRRLDG